MTTMTVRTCSEDWNEALQGCFEVTDWNALCELRGEDIDGLTECITDYINFMCGRHCPSKDCALLPKQKALGN